MHILGAGPDRELACGPRRLSMIRKSGNRFSEKILLKQGLASERDLI
jgi:hypothetical protein